MNAKGMAEPITTNDGMGNTEKQNKISINRCLRDPIEVACWIIKCLHKLPNEFNGAYISIDEIIEFSARCNLEIDELLIRNTVDKLYNNFLLIRKTSLADEKGVRWKFGYFRLHDDGKLA